ncbi:hypothetical protein [Terrihalobacillus insolitus]|uniref:hypothetical protein n=1 Tax=Terrihalobacillus insolitus TaxID=2950438 RepID=UPI00234154D8|nr:hypothetical protein [Terrihalobacillus insolitus]MDC3413189.1 hypothetical protein [Terrihalobacillus insolitus]
MKVNLLERFKVIGLTLLLIVGTLSTTLQPFSVSAQSLEPDNLEGLNMELQKEYTNSKGEKVSDYDINPDSDSPLDVEIVDKGDTVEVTTFLEGKETSKTIKNKETGELVTIENGEVRKSNVSDYVTITKTNPQNELSVENKSELIVEPEYYVPYPGGSGGMDYLTSDYNAGVGEYGYLYGKITSTSYGNTYNIEFGVGETVSVILGVLTGLVSSSFGLGLIVTALGSAIVGDAITEAIDGSAYARFREYDLEGYSQGELGLVTQQTDVDARVTNYKGESVSTKWVELRKEGDTRSWADMCAAAAYNVYIDNL